jgi:hypothetical protein
MIRIRRGCNDALGNLAVLLDLTQRAPPLTGLCYRSLGSAATISGVAALSHFSAAAALFSARESARPQLANGKPYMSAVSTGHDAAGTAVERIRLPWK